MSVWNIPATPMLPVTTLMEATHALAILDTLETDSLA